MLNTIFALCSKRPSGVGGTNEENLDGCWSVVVAALMSMRVVQMNVAIERPSRYIPICQSFSNLIGCSDVPSHMKFCKEGSDSRNMTETFGTGKRSLPDEELQRSADSSPSVFLATTAGVWVSRQQLRSGPALCTSSRVKHLVACLGASQEHSQSCFEKASLVAAPMPQCRPDAEEG